MLTYWPGHRALFCVGKGRLEADAAGGLIDQVVDQRERSLAELLLIAAALSKDLER